MAVAGLIVAAGRGRRLGEPVPKQYQPVGTGTVLSLAARSLLDHPAVTRVVVVIHPGDRDLYDAALADFSDPRLEPPVPGGAQRSDSVQRGLAELAKNPPERVLIHDAARPFVSRRLVDAVLAALDETDGACPALPVVDALWRGAGGLAEAPVPREELYRAQTPQGFRFGAILAAHRCHRGSATDDVTVARAAGLTVRLVPGEENAFKVTTAEDLARARALADGGAEDRPMDVRTGQGFDVHAFGPGEGLTLCGVRLAFERALVGHSDADVGLHALTDAVFGALAEGDIGRWFPPSDPQWKGASSDRFLAKAVERAAARGFTITHLDCTLVCERPKIGPHAEAMRAAIARIVGVAVDRVSVKATTSERLGFAGREEGIAALATATLVSA